MLYIEVARLLAAPLRRSHPACFISGPCRTGASRVGLLGFSKPPVRKPNWALIPPKESETEPLTVEARSLEYDCLLISKQEKEGKPAYVTLHPCSSFLESVVVPIESKGFQGEIYTLSKG